MKKEGDLLFYIVMVLFILGITLYKYSTSRSLDTFSGAVITDLSSGRKSTIRYEFLASGRKYKGSYRTYSASNYKNADSIIIVFSSQNPNKNAPLINFPMTRGIVDSLNQFAEPSEYIGWYNY